MPIARDNPFDAFLPELPSGGAPPPAPAPPGGGYASYRDPVTGRPVLAPVANAPVGIPYRLSAGVDPTTGRTPQGDAFNPFRGYVAPEGGGFGAGSGSRTAFESLTGVSADKLGDTSRFTPADWQTITRQFGGIANGDKASVEAGLTAQNPFLRRTAAAYALGRGSAGLSDADFAKYEQGGLGAFAPSDAPAPSGVPPAVDPAPSGPAAPDFNAFSGRFDSPTAASHVITPASEAAFNAARSAFENFRPSAPQPGATMPTTPPNPFQPFAAAPPPAPTDMGGMKPASAPALAPGALPPGVAPAPGPPAIDYFAPGAPTLGTPWTAAPYQAGQQAATSPAGITASGGYPGMMGQRYAMAGLNRFRKPGAGGPQFGVQQNGFLGGAGGASAAPQY